MVCVYFLSTSPQSLNSTVSFPSNDTDHWKGPDTPDNADVAVYTVSLTYSASPSLWPVFHVETSLAM